MNHYVGLVQVWMTPSRFAMPLGAAEKSEKCYRVWFYHNENITLNTHSHINRHKAKTEPLYLLDDVDSEHCTLLCVVCLSRFECSEQQNRENINGSSSSFNSNDNRSPSICQQNGLCVARRRIRDDNLNCRATENYTHIQIFTLRLYPSKTIFILQFFLSDDDDDGDDSGGGNGIAQRLAIKLQKNTFIDGFLFPLYGYYDITAHIEWNIVADRVVVVAIVGAHVMNFPLRFLQFFAHADTHTAGPTPRSHNHRRFVWQP